MGDKLRPDFAVRFLRGSKYHGRCGSVVRLTKEYVYVSLDGCSQGEKPVRVLQHMVEPLERAQPEETPEDTRAAEPEFTSAAEEPDIAPEEAHPPREAEKPPSGEERTPGTILHKREERAAVCLLTTRFPLERLEVHEVQLPLLKDGRLPRAVRREHDCVWELAAAKECEVGIDFLNRKRYLYRLYYVQTEAPGLAPIKLQEELERLADFAGQRCCPRKLAARLELLVSPCQSQAAKAAGALKLSSGDFELIPESSSIAEMSDGCGFIPDEMLLRLLGGGTGALARLRALVKEEKLPVKTHNTSGRGLLEIARDVDAVRKSPCVADILSFVALQVRAIGPGLGLAKGMLMRKAGISKIQLPPSMLKVGRPASTEDWVLLVVTQEHPVSSNVALGRLLKGEEVPKKSLKVKELGGIVTRLWRALGAPKELVEGYQERIRKEPSSAEHAWLVGVADPTDALPAGHIFVSGASGTAIAERSRLFVSRMPAVKRRDGRLLPQVRAKPEAMAEEAWQWLRKLPFGALLFPTLGEGKPLPSSVADGDLDGDLYLVCWAAELLASMREPPPEEESAEPCGREKAVLLAEDAAVIGSGEPWLAQVQAHLTDANILAEGLYKGKLFGRMERLQKEKGFGDEDARAYGEAYVQALERAKHGKAIELPSHLHF